MFRRYRTQGDAIQHLRQEHFNENSHNGEPHEETLALWIRNEDQWWAQRRLELFIRHMDLILEPLKKIHRKGRGIWDGVASGKHSMASGFSLPNPLVMAFQTTVSLLVYAAKSFSDIQHIPASKIHQNFTGATYLKADMFFLNNTQATSYLGGVAKVFMNQAEQDVMLMAYTGTNTDTFSYDSVGPEYILATIMTELFNGPLHADQSVDLVYVGFYRKLVS